MRITSNLVRVLSAFLESDLPLAGSDLIKRYGLFPGSLYPMLDRLEAEGFLMSRWEGGDPREMNRPNRREYALLEDSRDKVIAIVSLPRFAGFFSALTKPKSRKNERERHEQPTDSDGHPADQHHLGAARNR